MSKLVYGGGYFGTEVVRLYRRPQRQVVLPERKPEIGPDPFANKGWNACLDWIEQRLNK